MTKRMNRIAIALWAAAAVYFVGKLAALPFGPSFTAAFEGLPTLGADGKALLDAVGHFYDSIRILEALTAAILGAGQLAALGAVVELLDRIRWQGSAQIST